MSIENEKIKLQIIYHSILQKIKPSNKLPQIIEIRETEFPGSLNLDKEALFELFQRLDDLGVIKFLGVSKEDPEVYDGEYVGDTPFYEIKVLKWISLSSALQRGVGTTNGVESENYKLEVKSSSILNLPTDAQWEDIEIKFLNQYDIDIYFKGKFFKKSNNEELGFFRTGTKDKSPDIQWEFLQMLSIIYNNENISNATIETIASTFNKKESNCMKIKQKLSEKLQEVFGIKQDPFYDYEERDAYQTRFKLKPESELRGNGEVFITRTRYDDKKKYEILNE